MKLKKMLYLLIGFLGVVLGAVGAVVPMLPAFPFLLMAAFGFGKSSERLERWFKGTRLYRENLDSVLYYQSIASGNLSSIEGTRLEGMYYAQEGMYQMKSKWDFPTMVAMLLRSYDVYKELGEVSDMVYALTNIVNFYYMRSDVRGMEYAEEAWVLSTGIGFRYIIKE